MACCVCYKDIDLATLTVGLFGLGIKTHRMECECELRRQESFPTPSALHHGAAEFWQPICVINGHTQRIICVFGCGNHNSPCVSTSRPSPSERVFVRPSVYLAKDGGPNLVVNVMDADKVTAQLSLRSHTHAPRECAGPGSARLV